MKHLNVAETVFVFNL